MSELSRALRVGNRNPVEILRKDLDAFFIIHGIELPALAGSNTTIKVEKFGNGQPIMAGGGLTYTMQYHSTDVVSWYPDGSVSLRDGGHQTMTTKRRMNWALLPLGWRLYQHEWTWRLWRIGCEDDAQDVTYTPGMIVSPVWKGTEHNT